MRYLSGCAALLILLLLTACGGGGGGNSSAADNDSTVTIVALGSLPLTGQAIDANAFKIFEVTGLTADTFYTFTITAANSTLAVFDDALLRTNLCFRQSINLATSCIAKPSGNSLFFRVTENAGSADSFEINVVQTPSTVAALGSLPLTSQTLPPAGIALIEVTGLAPGTFYTFSTTAASNLDIVVYDDANFFSFLCSSFTSTTSGVASCAARPTGNSLFVQISNSSASSGSFDFNVVVTPLSFLSPADLPLANQTLAAGEITLYAIDGLTPGTTYTVSAVGANTKEMGVYNNETLSNFLCGSLASAGVNSCAVTPPATTLFIQLRNSSSLQDSYTFNVVQTPITPVPLGGLPLSGQSVSAELNALYEITGLTPNTYYTISITGSGNIDLEVHGSSFFQFPSCISASDTGIESCDAQTSGSSLFVRVLDVAGLGHIFELSVVETPVTAVPFSSLPLAGQVLPARGIRLYEITGLTPGTFYSFSATGPNGESLNAFDDAGFSNFLCSAFTGEACAAAPSGNSLFLRVSDFSLEGDTFELNATETPLTVTTIGNLPLAGQTLPAGGTVLFEISGLTTGSFYSISAIGTNSKELQVFNDRADNFTLCRSRFSNVPTGTASCTAEPAGNSLFVQVSDSDLSGLGDTFDFNIAEVPITASTLGAPALENVTLPANGTALFEVSGLTAGTFYTVTATGSNSKQLQVINESDRLVCNVFSQTGDSSCDAEADGTTFFVRVDDESGLGDSFSFNVIEVPVTDSALNNMPLANQVVAPNGVSLFEITGLTANTFYTVSVTGTNSRRLVVSDSRTSVFLLCSSFVSGGPQNCAARPSGTSIFVQVSDFSGLGDSFELNVVQTPVTVSALGALPLSSEVLSPVGIRQYEITGLTANTFYSVSSTGSNVKELLVYDNSSAEFPLCSSLTNSGLENCAVRPSGTSLFLSVTDLSGLGDSFGLNVVQTPVTVSALGALPLASQTLPANGIRLFEITGLTANTFYSVSSTGSNDKELLVYDNSTDEFQLCSSFANSGLENCTTRPSGTSLFVSVRDVSGLGDSFELNVVQTPVTVSALGALPLASQTLPANGIRLFEITGLTANTYYTVSSTGSNDRELLVYDNITAEFPLCSLFTNSGLENCAVRPSGTSLFVSVTDFSGLGDSFELNVVQTPVTVSALGVLPLSGEVLSPGGIRQYEITGLTAATTYTVSTTGTNGKVIQVYDDATLANFLCGSIAGTGLESCDATPSSSSLFVQVFDSSGLGDSFELDVVATVF